MGTHRRAAGGRHRVRLPGGAVCRRGARAGLSGRHRDIRHQRRSGRTPRRPRRAGPAASSRSRCCGRWPRPPSARRRPRRRPQFTGDGNDLVPNGGELNQDIFDALAGLCPQLLKRAGAIADQHALPLSCVKAVHLLGTPLSMKELARRMHCDPSFVTVTADTLESAGWPSGSPMPPTAGSGIWYSHLVAAT